MVLQKKYVVYVAIGLFKIFGYIFNEILDDWAINTTWDVNGSEIMSLY